MPRNCSQPPFLAYLTEADEAIPILDVAPYLGGHAGAAEATAQALRTILEGSGFFYLINHGIPAALRDRVLAMAARFYALPLAQKLALKMTTIGTGYVPMGGELPRSSPYYSGTTKPDVSEAYVLQRDWGAGHRPTHNPWPAGLPGFRSTLRAFFDAVEALSLQLLPLYARALDVEAAYFAEKFPPGHALSVLRVSRMPPKALAADEFHIGPHTDSSFITLLATSAQPGLEIQTPAGRWLPVPFLPEAFVVNAGDMLARWSNGRVRSTPHRVIHTADVDRYSLPFFLHPTPDTVLACLPSCCGPGHPPQQPPITCAAYLEWFLAENFALGEHVYNADGQHVLTSSAPSVSEKP